MKQIKLLVYSVLAATLVLSVWSALAQTGYSATPTATSTPTPIQDRILLEDRINVPQSLALVGTQLAAKAKISFDMWNSLYGDFVVQNSSEILRSFGRGNVFEGYPKYKLALNEKLRVFEEARIAHYLALEGDVSTKAQRQLRLNEVFARFDRELLDAKAAPNDCSDKTPAGLCWCKLTKTYPSGTPTDPSQKRKYERDITACYQLDARVTLVGPLVRTGCGITVLDDNLLLPSSTCTCGDVSPLLSAMEISWHGKTVEVCVPGAGDELRRGGLIPKSCPDQGTFGGLDALDLLPEQICEPVAGQCDSTKNLLSSTNVVSLPPATRRNLTASLDDTDRRLASAAYFNCGSAPRDTIGGSPGGGGGGGSPQPPEDPGHGGDDDPWLSPPPELKAMHSIAFSFSEENPVRQIQPSDKFESPPQLTAEGKKILR